MPEALPAQLSTQERTVSRVTAGAHPVTVRADVTEFKRLFDKSSQVDKKLKSALRRNIRRAGGEVADAVRSEVGQGTLRSRIAAGVQVKVMTGARAGVTIVASSKAMGPGQESLVRAWESKKGWRHRVFGTGTYVTQTGHPYFRRTVFERRSKVTAAVEAAMVEAAESLR